MRLLSGLALGLLAWYGWVQAFGDTRRMDDVAVTGPMVGLIAAPLISVLLTAGGARLVFGALAVVSLVPLAFGYRSAVDHLPRTATRNRAVPAARILLICLGLFTLGGSSVFVFAVVLGTANTSMSVTVIAVGFSLNALVAIPAVRWKAPRKFPSPPMAAAAACVILIATSAHSWLFFGALVAWGFFFWLAIPGVFEVLASRSRYPEERAGDAQAVMAAGRAGGPLLGGLLIDGLGATALGVVGGRARADLRHRSLHRPQRRPTPADPRQDPTNARLSDIRGRGGGGVRAQLCSAPATPHPSKGAASV